MVRTREIILLLDPAVIKEVAVTRQWYLRERARGRVTGEEPEARAVVVTDGGLFLVPVSPATVARRLGRAPGGA
ncbi:MAG: hypothetical protein OWV35_04635 [Firmicutes bacterium]|nr:hypothetical protein [Bacillota bacterium]